MKLMRIPRGAFLPIFVALTSTCALWWAVPTFSAFAEDAAANVETVPHKASIDRAN